MQCRSLRIPFRSTRIRSTVSTPDVERGPEGSMLPCPAEAKPLARSASLRGRCFGFIDLDDPAAACVEDLPEDVVHVRALGRVMRFGLLEASCGAGFRPYDEAFPDHLRADRPQYALGLTRAGPGAGMGGRGERQRACGGRTVHRDGGDASSTRRYQRFHPYLFRHFSAPERRIERFAGHPLRFVERGRQDRPGRLGRAEGALQGR